MTQVEVNFHVPNEFNFIEESSFSFANNIIIDNTLMYEQAIVGLSDTYKTLTLHTNNCSLKYKINLHSVSGYYLCKNTYTLKLNGNIKYKMYTHAVNHGILNEISIKSNTKSDYSIILQKILMILEEENNNDDGEEEEEEEWDNNNNVNSMYILNFCNFYLYASVINVKFNHQRAYDNAEVGITTTFKKFRFRSHHESNSIFSNLIFNIDHSFIFSFENTNNNRKIILQGNFNYENNIEPVNNFENINRIEFNCETPAAYHFLKMNLFILGFWEEM